MLSKVSDSLDVKSVTAANFMWQFKVAKVKLLSENNLLESTLLWIKSE